MMNYLLLQFVLVMVVLRVLKWMEWDGETDSTTNVTISLAHSDTNEYVEGSFTIKDEGENGAATELSFNVYGSITANKTVTTATVGSYLVTYTAMMSLVIKL